MNALLLAALLLLAGDAPESDPLTSPEVQALQGTWHQYSNGGEQWTIRFDGLRYEAHNIDGAWYKGRFALRSDRQPAELDIFIDECDCIMKGDVSRNIYRWEEGVLRMIASTPGMERPTEFKEDTPTTLSMTWVHERETACSATEGVIPQLYPERVLLFGELHGTDQSPAFVGDVLCRGVELGFPVVLGLEWAADTQPLIDRYLESADPQKARAVLLDHPIWKREYQDGRNSKAMLALLERARVLRRGGAAIELLAYDVPTGARVANRDLAMATTIAEALDGKMGILPIVLTGNIHSRLAAGGRFSGNLTPMGAHLVERLGEENVRSFNVSHEGGTAWICTPDCGVTALGGSAIADGVGKLHADKPAAGHTGVYSVGTLTASVPAVGDHVEPTVSPVPPPTPIPDPLPRETAALDSDAVQKLQGSWQAYQGGVKAWTIEFDGFNYYAVLSDDDWYKGRVFVRPDESPAEIDFLIEDCVCGYKGESSDAIFAWEGETLKLGTPMPSTPRPTYFNEQKGEVVVLQRP